MRSKLFQKLMEKRGLSEEFLWPDYTKLADPFLLPDMERLVERLILASERKEKVLVYGDYDADGVTAATEMAEILENIGVGEVEVMLPDRFRDGYGMNERVVKRAKEGGFTVVVTVDCGSNNGEVIEKLADVGVDVLVTDHHELSGEVPEKALAVVNPKRKDFGRRIGGDVGFFKEVGGGAEGRVGEGADRDGDVELAGHHLEDLCGAGVAFYVARAMRQRGKLTEAQEKWLADLAAIGTVCDSMVLLGDNRIICYYGMIVLEKAQRIGLRELMRSAGILPLVQRSEGASGAKGGSGAGGSKALRPKLKTEALGFQIGPRLNAAGRMKTAELALDLLRTKSKVEAVRLAQELEELNRERRRMQMRATDEIAEAGITEEPVLVVEGEWHEGVLGIIAGRLVEQYRKPSIVLTEVEDGYKGSARSFGEFNLAEALKECEEFLMSGGGHAMAAGLKVKKDCLNKFIEQINRYYKSLELKNQERFLRVEEDLSIGSLKSLSEEFLEELQLLEPFGAGNEEPVFLLNGVTILDSRWMGAEERHLGMTVKDGKGGIMRLVAFGAEREWGEFRPGEKVRAWVNVTKNEWQGNVSVEGRILRLEKFVDEF